jgi:uncharacterized protein YlaI
MVKNERKYMCQECGRRFVSKLSLASHVNMGHSGHLVGRVNGEKLCYLNDLNEVLE